MVEQLFWQSLSNQLGDFLCQEFSIGAIKAIAGGDINRSYRIADSNNQRHFFVKINRAENLGFFSSEETGLNHIERSHTILCPKPLLKDVINEYAFLVLEYHPIQPRGNEFLLGQQLAKMHQCTHPCFGFDDNNYIGRTPQNNTYEKSWATFFLNHRLAPQLQLAYQNGFEIPLKKPGISLPEITPRFLADHYPKASLVHGDLWGGNKGFLTDGVALIFDPACYYGDREVDIAMTHLFGGFGGDFYRGYESLWPLDNNYEKRALLYNLYHQLNHLNLFGASYLNACVSTMKSLNR